MFEARAAEVRTETRDQRAIRAYEATIEHALGLLEQFKLDNQVELTLADCVQRALANSYAVRIASYTPAISQANLVQAEAAFDAVFFLDSSWQNRDSPVPTQLVSGQSDSRSITGGIRQLLPTGAQVSTSLNQTRTFTDNQFATINPAYSTNFVASITQPLLRGFGLDVNRAQINIAKADYRIAREQFLRQVRDTLFDVESAYWRLLQARRDVAILAVSVAQNKVTYDAMVERGRHDATIIQISNAEARWKSRRVTLAEAVKVVRDLEDSLKNLLNDPQLTLSRMTEIIPIDEPTITPFAVDLFAEVRTALDARNEITEAKLGIERSRIQTHLAKNRTLPQLDLNFSYDVGGLETSADASFDHLTTNRFRSFTLGVQFSYPLGNRGPRAGLRAARLAEQQALWGLNRTTDGVVLEVNNAVRALAVRNEQITPSYEACRASERMLRALQARSQQIDPNFLESELNNVERLANDRRTLLQVVTEYNIAIVAKERAKGTLLEYNNVVVGDGSSGP